jgi:hypothetical protein
MASKSKAQLNKNGEKNILACLDLEEKFAI